MRAKLETNLPSREEKLESWISSESCILSESRILPETGNNNVKNRLE